MKESMNKKTDAMLYKRLGAWTEERRGQTADGRRRDEGRWQGEERRERTEASRKGFKSKRNSWDGGQARLR